MCFQKFLRIPLNSFQCWDPADSTCSQCLAIRCAMDRSHQWALCLLACAFFSIIWKNNCKNRRQTNPADLILCAASPRNEMGNISRYQWTVIVHLGFIGERSNRDWRAKPCAAPSAAHPGCQPPAATRHTGRGTVTSFMPLTSFRPGWKHPLTPQHNIPAVGTELPLGATWSRAGAKGEDELARVML